MVTIVPSSHFRRAVKHLDDEQKSKLEKAIRKILDDPKAGKPLKYLRGERALRMRPFRLVYSFRKDTQTLYLLKFDHKSSVYS